MSLILFDFNIKQQLQRNDKNTRITTNVYFNHEKHLHTFIMFFLIQFFRFKLGVQKEKIIEQRNLSFNSFKTFFLFMVSGKHWTTIHVDLT